MARVTLEREWVVRGAYGLDAAIERAARQQGLTVARSVDGLELRGGSQLKLRASGSLFTRDDYLPRRGVVQRSAVAGEDGVERVTLRLRDTLGFGVMDGFLRRKYERVLADAATAVEAALNACAPEVRSAASSGAPGGAGPDAPATPSTPAAPDDDGCGTILPEEP